MANPTEVTLQVGGLTVPSWDSSTVLVGGTGMLTDGSDSTYIESAGFGDPYALILNGDDFPEDAWISHIETTVRAERIDSGQSAFVDTYIGYDGENFDYFIDNFFTIPVGAIGSTTFGDDVDPFDVPLRFLSDNVDFSGLFLGGDGPLIIFDCKNVRIYEASVTLTYEVNYVEPPYDPPESGGGWTLATLTPGTPDLGLYRMYAMPMAAVGTTIYCFRPNANWYGHADNSDDEYWPLSKKLETGTREWFTFPSPPQPGDGSDFLGWDSEANFFVGGNYQVWRYAFSMPDDTILLFGHSQFGVARSGGYEVYFAKFHPDTETYTEVSYHGGYGSEVVTSHCAVYEPVNDLILFDVRSGDHLASYVPGTDTFNFSAGSVAWQADAYNSSGLAVDGKMYFCKGEGITPGFPGAPTTRLEIYNPATDTWSQTSEWPFVDFVSGSNTGMRGGTFLGAANGKILAFGGYTNNGYSVEVDEYEIATDTWSTNPDYPLGLAQGGGSGAGVVTIGGYHWQISGYYQEPLAHPANPVAFGGPYDDIWTSNTVYTNAPGCGPLYLKMMDGSWFYVGCEEC